MAESTDNAEDRISCDNSSYGECYLEVYDSSDGANSGSEDKEYGGGDTTHWERCLTSLYLLEPIGRLCDFASCSCPGWSSPSATFAGAYFQLTPFVYAHIQMSMFRSLHIVVLVGRGLLLR